MALIVDYYYKIKNFVSISYQRIKMVSVMEILCVIFKDNIMESGLLKQEDITQNIQKYQMTLSQ